MSNTKPSGGVWDASECALLLIDYQDHVFDVVFEQDRSVIELNVRTLAKIALSFEPCLATDLSQHRQTVRTDRVTCIQKRSSTVLHTPALHCIRLRWRRCADAVSS